MIESDYITRLNSENDRAQAEMRDFLCIEVQRILNLLQKKKNIHMTQDRLDSIKLLLENPTTAKIVEPEFSIFRNFSNGFDIKWYNEQQQAA